MWEEQRGSPCGRSRASKVTARGRQRADLAGSVAVTSSVFTKGQGDLWEGRDPLPTQGLPPGRAGRQQSTWQSPKRMRALIFPALAELATGSPAMPVQLRRQGPGRAVLPDQPARWCQPPHRCLPGRGQGCCGGALPPSLLQGCGLWPGPLPGNPSLTARLGWELGLPGGWASHPSCGSGSWCSRQTPGCISCWSGGRGGGRRDPCTGGVDRRTGSRPRALGSGDWPMKTTPVTLVRRSPFPLAGLAELG